MVGEYKDTKRALYITASEMYSVALMHDIKNVMRLGSQLTDIAEEMQEMVEKAERVSLDGLTEGRLGHDY